MKIKNKKRSKINWGDWIVWAIILSCVYILTVGIIKSVFNYFGWSL